MKKEIHPNYHKIKVVMTDGTEFETRSTLDHWLPTWYFQFYLGNGNDPIICSSILCVSGVLETSFLSRTFAQ